MYRFIFPPIAFLCWILFSVLFRWRVTGLENIPAGGAIIAPNHQSFWDIPLVGLALHERRTHFMAKSELFNNAVFAWVIRNLLAFPVKRGTPDRAAIRHAVEMLKQGDLVAIFPEGTRSKTGTIGTAEAGLSLIASRADVPVVPVGILGTRRIFSRESFLPQVEIRFGAPLYVRDYGSGNGETKTDLGIQVMQSIHTLVHAGRPCTKK